MKPLIYIPTPYTDLIPKTNSPNLRPQPKTRNGPKLLAEPGALNAPALEQVEERIIEEPERWMEACSCLIFLFARLCV